MEISEARKEDLEVLEVEYKVLAPQRIENKALKVMAVGTEQGTDSK